MHLEEERKEWRRLVSNLQTTGTGQTLLLLPQPGNMPKGCFSSKLSHPAWSSLAWEAFCLQRVVGAPQFKYFSSRKMATDSPCH